MPELITPTEYARRRPCHHTAVLKAIKSGRISLIDGKIDPDVADIQWAKNTRPRIQQQPQPTPAVTAPTHPEPAAPSPDSPYDLQLSRAKREHHEAALAEMRERKMAGELVELIHVNQAYTTLAAQLRATLERVPDKLAPRLAAETDTHAIHTLLAEHLDQALLDMSRAAEQLPARLIESNSRD